MIKNVIVSFAAAVTLSISLNSHAITAETGNLDRANVNPELAADVQEQTIPIPKILLGVGIVSVLLLRLRHKHQP